MLEIRKIKTRPEFDALKSKWSDLLKQTDASSIFLSHEWFSCCIESFGNDKKINILVVEEDSKVIGIAPLWLYSDFIRRIPVRRISLIKVPDTPFTDFIVENSKQKQILSAMLAYLLINQRRCWDVLTLDPLPQKSPTYSFLQHLISTGKIKTFKGFDSHMPFITISGIWEDFFKSKSSRFRKTQRNIANKIKKTGTVKIERIIAGSVEELLSELVYVSKRSWKAEAGVALSISSQAIRFFYCLTKIAMVRGWLLAWLLKIDDRSVAMEYDLVCENKVYALRADYNQSFKEYSPGTYLETQIIQNLFENVYSEYNSGPGLFAYKLKWTRSLKRQISLNLCNKTPLGKGLWMLEACLIPWLKSIRKRLKNRRNPA